MATRIGNKLGLPPLTCDPYENCGQYYTGLFGGLGNQGGGVATPYYPTGYIYNANTPDANPANNNQQTGAVTLPIDNGLSNVINLGLTPAVDPLAGIKNAITSNPLILIGGAAFLIYLLTAKT